MSDCKTVRLGDVATYINGYAFKPSDWGTEGLPIIRIQNLTGNYYETNFYNGKIPEKYFVKNGDVLISWSASLGVYEWKKNDALLNQHIFKVVFDKLEVDKKYFMFTVSNLLNAMSKQTHGSTMRHITKPDFDNMPFPLPPIEKQKQIARKLDKCNELILKNNRILEKYDLLIKSRFIEMFGDPVTNPKGWNEVKISELCKSPDDIKCGPFGTQLCKDEYQKSGIPVFGIPQINSSFNVSPTDFLTNTKAEKLDDYSLVCGDIAMSRKGNVGKCAIYSGQDKGIIHSDVVRLRVDNSVCNPVYLMNQLHISPKIETQISNVSSGAIMAGINVTKLKNIIVYNPPILMQNDFANFVHQIDKSKFEYKTKEIVA